jgi:hypothetical protein
VAVSKNAPFRWQLLRTKLAPALVPTTPEIFKKSLRFIDFLLTFPPAFLQYIVTRSPNIFSLSENMGLVNFVALSNT